MDLFSIISFFVVFLISISFHESAHALMAYKLGDSTAKDLGRISLNPLRHISPIGTILLPLIGLLSPSHSFFGWAKPTPYNPHNLKDGHKDEIFIALAGPFTNILLALVFTGLFYLFAYVLSPLLPPNVAKNILSFLSVGVIENFLLAFFNLLPIPPLDGSSLLKIFVPRRFHVQLALFNQYGLLILLVLSTGYFGNIIGDYLDTCVNFCLKIVGLL
ncbi:MAG TPA: site-2 protease family protein [Candidatus Saccharimonadales bacterium]|nr:site-2 protease family protein [Candidatus Saccharimonadales bacterium]